MTEATETGTGTPFEPTGADEDLLYILSDTYECTRVWEAWGYGTMTDADFQPAAETDLLHELIAWRDAAVAAERGRWHADGRGDERQTTHGGQPVDTRRNHR